RIPLFVKAGSILPLGPPEEYAGQSPDAAVELRIYRGADGSFNLYNDEGDNYDYEKGAWAIIPVRWDDASSTLTLGAHTGSYPGMPQHRTFRVILVSANHGVGPQIAAKADREVQYDGQSVSVVLK
ncbi:MAG: DUF5110 domain-containing protein, partial [Acidobacteriaceae bacterium]